MSESDRDAAGLDPENERADTARPTVPRRAILKTGAAAGAAAAAFLLAPKLGGGGTASADPGQSGGDHGQAGDPPGQSGDASGPPTAAPGESASAPPHLAVPLRERTVTVHVLADLSTFVIFGGGDTGPFHVRGDLVENDDGTGAVVGAFQCWGVIHAGGAVVTQEYDLGEQGKIVTAGVEDNSPRPVTGGTGDFSNVGGDMTTDLTNFPDPDNFFTAVFTLIG